jgi:hypothetical protein
MTEKEERDLRKYCAFILEKYGFQIAPTDPVIPALYIIHREFLSSRKSNEQIAESLQNMLSKVKTVNNFNVPGEAWRFQLVKSIKLLWAGLTLVMLFWAYLFWLDLSDEVEKAKLIITTSDRVSSTMLKRVKKDSEGYLYIDFEKPTGNSVRSFYEFDKIDDRLVRVYLGRDSETSK